ncbi:MAG: hypothetical protein KAH33_02055 [Candidatus Delongbacteria bacterium]|nr:hypothetical protein [Candidatus Delongbacteria bacterium]
MKKLLQVLLTVLIGALLFNTIGCSDDDGATAPPPPPPEPTILKIIVKSSLDSSVIQNSNVVIFQAETKEAIIRNLTDANGECGFDLDQGNYYVELSAQEFDQAPAENVTPIPFFVVEEDTTAQTFYLNENGIDPGIIGYIKGYVTPATNNFLILAESASGKYATVTGPDGFFIMYNLPYANYAMEALKAGYKMDTDTIVTVDGSEIDVLIQVSDYVGSTLTGSITFLATTDTLDVDVVLRDPETGAVIPGLTANEDGGNYTLNGIPDGDYIAWASFENDGYVLDPDWVFKNPDGLNMSFISAIDTTLNFSVTGSVKMISPTNPADSIYAFMADSIVPTFSWEGYPSTKEYIIEVRDLSGNVIWGGFDPDGTVNHGYIDDADLSVEYDFDGSASEALVPGNIYQWKIWADKGTAFDSQVEQLISTSEDLRGIFQVPELPVK